MATGVLYGRIHFNISLQRSKSSANTTPTHALHILQKHHPRTTITRARGIQRTQFKKVVEDTGTWTGNKNTSRTRSKVEDLMTPWAK